MVDGITPVDSDGVGVELGLANTETDPAGVSVGVGIAPGLTPTDSEPVHVCVGAGVVLKLTPVGSDPVGNIVGVGDAEIVALMAPTESVAVAVAVEDEALLKDAVALASGLLVALADAVKNGLTEAVPEPELLGESDAADDATDDATGDAVGDVEAVADGVTVPDAVHVAEALDDFVGSVLMDAFIEAVPEPDALAVIDAAFVAEAETVAEIDAAFEAEAEAEAVAEGDGLCAEQPVEADRRTVPGGQIEHVSVEAKTRL